MEYMQLGQDVNLPMLGYGTWHIPSKEIKGCVLEALQCGYRLIDTAASYFNEKEIGEAIRTSKMPREEIFVTSKVWVQDAGYQKTIHAFETSLKQLQLDYLDVYLIHQPYGDYYGAWKALEDLYQQGKIKVIGVSNFSNERYVDLYMNAKIKPMINQIEVHPFYQQEDDIQIFKRYHCAIQAWGPLNEGQRNIFQNDILKKIADKHHKTVAQVVLRWNLQRGVMVIPKTISQKRMKENLDVFDFQLDEEDFKAIKQLDIGYSEIIDHQCYKTAKWLNQCKIHE